MNKTNSKIAGFILGLLFTVGASAEPVALNPSHPDRYVVIKGDTLWDISAKFLEKPWLWPEIWQVNPQIENPHLIYPGDTVLLSYSDGQPRLTVRRGAQTVKLSPRVRETPINQAIPTIPIDAIQQFLSQPRVLGKGELDDAPYIVAFADEHIIGGAGVRAYVRAIEASENPGYVVIRPGKAYEDPDSGEILGYEGIYVGDASLERSGDPATVSLFRTEREAIVGDRLIPASEDTVSLSFQPRSPASEVRGRIISVLDGISQIGQYQVVVLSRGARDGLEPGHVLAIDQAGERVPDPVTRNTRDSVRLPDEEAGLLIVFRSFERVSFALVLEAKRAIHLLDVVRNP